MFLFDIKRVAFIAEYCDNYVVYTSVLKYLNLFDTLTQNINLCNSRVQSVILYVMSK